MVLKLNLLQFGKGTKEWVWRLTQCIHRGLFLIASWYLIGEKSIGGNVVIELVIGIENKNWSIVPSTFMQ